MLGKAEWFGRASYLLTGKYDFDMKIIPMPIDWAIVSKIST